MRNIRDFEHWEIVVLRSAVLDATAAEDCPEL